MRKGPFPPPQTPPLFSKPFPGIYLFALQIDKCHSSFKKFPIQKLIIKIFNDLPVLGTELIENSTGYAAEPCSILQQDRKQSQLLIDQHFVI